MLLAHALVALAPATIPPPAEAPAWNGPPAICHPIAIDGARSLPWGDGPFAVDPGYDPVRDLVGDTLGVLDESFETFVHMETIRRAVIYATGMGSGGAPVAIAERRKLIEGLRKGMRDAAVEAALSDHGSEEQLRRREALAWFDVGYFDAALGQSSWRLEEHGFRALEKASKMAQDDGAMHLGVALGLWRQGGDQASLYRHLDEAVRRCDESRKDLLSRNLLATAARFLGCDSHAELRSALDEKLGRA